jgi:hypothetical protein
MLSSIAMKLSDCEERLAINWETVKLTDTPEALNRLARVVHGIEHNFPADNFYHWITESSVTFRHKHIQEIEVRVWVDDDNELSDLLFSTLLPPVPIAVGLDLTAHSIFDRQMIRAFLRANYKYYCDPERALRPLTEDTTRKVSILPDCSHWHDVVFLTDFSRDTAIDTVRVKAIEHAIGVGARSW